MKTNRISLEINSFGGREAPEIGNLIGYGAVIDFLKLEIPIPNQLALISKKHKNYRNANWQVLSPRYQPEETLYAHLVFAIKYEGINLLFFKKLFEKITTQQVLRLIQKEYTGRYARKIWFLYEWLMNEILPIPDLTIKNLEPLIDESLQFASSRSINSKRHRIKNNLPGTFNFCPLIYKSEKLKKYTGGDLTGKTNSYLKNVHKDILLRTSAFLLLKDSRASFNIEGENPTNNRAIRWGRAIGQAGSKPLNKNELLRLQQILIEDSRFVKMGYRTEGGFVGSHDRLTSEPIPDHISASWQDVEALMSGLIETAVKLENDEFNPVLTAAVIAFGFVFIHPFVDANGRIHRYLFHHILAKMKYTPQGIIFPVSTAILEKIEDYKRVLENYSFPLHDFIKWRKTNDNNVDVLNETIDYYRYFDATLHAEFLYDCIDYTSIKIIPDEISYLQKYDEMKNWLDDKFQMPDKMVDLLIKFLSQNDGKLSKRAKGNEFLELTESEISEIEQIYKRIFL